MKILTIVTLLFSRVLVEPLGAEGLGMTLSWKDLHVGFCRGDKDVMIDSALIRGTLEYKNVSPKAVLLLRQPHTRGDVSLRSLGVQASGPPEYTFSRLVVREAGSRPRNYQRTDFVLLESGETYAEDYSFSFLIQRIDSTPAVPPDGDYHASVLITLWSDSREAAFEVAGRLGKTPIWTDPLWSPPVLIHLRSDQPVVPCH